MFIFLVSQTLLNKSTMRKIGMLCFVLLSMLGCQSDDKADVKVDDVPVAIDFISLKQWDDMNSPLPVENYVLRKASEWVKFKENKDIQVGAEVNFETHEVIVVFDEPRESTGYSIEVKSIVKKDGKLIVEVQKYSPELGEEVFKIPRQPYHIVMLERTGFSATFKEKSPN